MISDRPQPKLDTSTKSRAVRIEALRRITARQWVDSVDQKMAIPAEADHNDRVAALAAMFQPD